MQHARDQSFQAVIGFYLARDRAHARIAERTGDGEQGVGLDHAVRIDGGYNLTPRLPESRVERGALAEVAFKPQRRYKRRIFARGLFDVPPGIVLAAVIDDQN